MPVSEQAAHPILSFFQHDTPVDLGALTEPSDLIWHILGSPDYKSSARAQKNGLGWPLNQVFVNQRDKILYCPIGKNACTFLKREMTRLARHPDFDFILKNVHLFTDHVNTGLLLGDHKPAQVNTFLTSPNYFRFAVLRDPFKRLLSAYIEKFVVNRNQPPNQQHTISIVEPTYKRNGAGDPDFDRGITFSEFVDTICTIPHLKLDTHWRPQYTYLQGCNYDRLYRFENLNTVLNDLEKRTGVSAERSAQNVTSSGQGKDVSDAHNLLPAEIEAIGKISYASFLSADIFDKVRSYYQRDYQLIEQAN